MARLALGLEDRRDIFREGDLLRRIGRERLRRDRERSSKCDDSRRQTPAPAYSTTLHERLLAHSPEHTATTTPRPHGDEFGSISLPRFHTPAARRKRRSSLDFR